MAERNRSTLKNFFSEGQRPTADHFTDLIDSNLNMIDEGFSRTVENGFEVSLLEDSDRLISFFESNDPEHDPVWSITLNQERDKLIFKKVNQYSPVQNVLTLTSDGCVGVNNDTPQHDLDVSGVVRSKGRMGAYETIKHTVPADGGWHDITGELEGCVAFEVMAGAGGERGKHTGKFALMHAIAMNTFNPRGWFFNFLNRKKKIRYTHAYYRSAGNRLKLQWCATDGNKYKLQIKSNCDYGSNLNISYHITQLWFDPFMEQSWESGTSNDK